jgi:hypothetical protein
MLFPAPCINIFRFRSRAWKQENRSLKHKQVVFILKWATWHKRKKSPAQLQSEKNIAGNCQKGKKIRIDVGATIKLPLQQVKLPP